MPQTSVSLSPAIAMDGQLEPSAPRFSESCTCDETNGIPFGRAVSLKSAANMTVDLVASAAEAAAAFGVALRDPTLPASTSLFDDGVGLSVIRAGAVWVKVENAVTRGATPYVRHTAGATLTALGRFRADDGDEGAGALAASRQGWEYLDSASAGGYARVWLGSPAAMAQKETVLVTMDIPDISTADTVYAASPVAGRVVKIYSCIDAAITVADAVLTTAIGGAAITGGSLTVAFSGSAPGDVDVATPTDANVVTAGATLSVATDGGSTTTSLCRVTFVIEVG